MIELQKNTAILHILLIVVLGFSVYANCLPGKFIWDDQYHITKNIFIRGWPNLGQIFSKNMGVGSGYPSPFYRPIQSVIYLLNYCLWGLNPFSFHLTSIILHILVAIAIYYLINMLVLNRLTALVAGLFFIAHPLTVETVAFISNLADILAALFMILSISLYIKYLRIDTIKAYTLIALTYISALLSKENSLILPLLLLMFHWVFKKKVNLRKFLFITGIAVAYLIMRSRFLHSSLISTSPETAIFKRIPVFFAAIAQYLTIIFLPFNLHMEYSYRLFSFSEPKVIFGLISSAILLIWAAKQKEKNSFASFSIFWFFIMLLPVSNIYSINDSYIAERWLYLPAIGIFVALADRLIYLYNKRNSRAVTAFVIMGLLCFYSVLVINQNKYWRDPIYFYERTLKFNPESAKIYNELGIEYETLGRDADAEQAYKNAIKYRPGLSGVYYNLGRLHQKLGKLDQAISDYSKEIELNYNYAPAYNNRAVVYYSKKDYGKAWADVYKAQSLGYRVNSGFLEALKKASGRAK